VRGREGRQDAAALRYCCAVAFLEFSEFYHLPHGAITPHCSLLKAVRPEQPNGVSRFLSSVAVLATSVIGVSRGDHSPSAISAPSLDQLVASGSLISYQQVRVITVIQIFLLSSQSLFQHNHPNFSSLSLTQWSLKLNGMAGAPTSTYPVLSLLSALFSVSVVAYFSTKS
jgi:hypothetical protein